MMKKRIIIFIVIILLISAFYLYSGRIKIIKYKSSNNLKTPLRILHISDLHIKKNKLIYNELARKINKINPDLLLITGDSIEDNRGIHLLEGFLKKINYDIKKYAIIGNWENWGLVDRKKLDEIYSINNCILLINNGDFIEINGTKINIYGVDDLISSTPNITEFKFYDDAINIFLVHCPQYFDIIKEEFINKRIYFFSGHAHGGQITFFGKPLRLPAGCGEYLKGKYKYNNLTMYVSKGIGNSVVDFRMFARPDIILVEFEKFDG